MLQRAVLISDDIGPHEEHLHYMVLTADWARRDPKATLLKIDIRSCYFYAVEKIDRYPEFAANYRQQGYVRRGSVWRNDTSDVWANTRLRTNGGHFVPFALKWIEISRAAAKENFNWPEHMTSFVGGDFFPSLSQELIDGEVRRIPFRFTRADARAYPQTYAVLRKQFDLAVKHQNYCAQRLEDFPDGTPFRAVMIRRHPNRHFAGSADFWF